MSLAEKYNVPGPRYTSYPTVPDWDPEGISIENWKTAVEQTYRRSKDQGLSIYIHLPFCESMCTFCGCHKRITRQHSVEQGYIDAVLKEWSLYLNQFDGPPNIREIHLGGGTPTFFAPEQLTRLIQGIVESSTLLPEYEMSFEGHPNNTTREHLQALYDVGFRRVSFGVQDYSPTVQQAINRIQPYERVKLVHDTAREIGYTSISHDLVFGLPHQTAEDIENTVRKTLDLRPERLSFYSYAHVPWIKGVGQRGFDENDLPRGAAKRRLYELGKQMLEAEGYLEIGMDHFALREDELFQAFDQGTLHRNFMGYTTNPTKVMIGLGMSSISDAWTAFAQNEKSLEDYLTRVNNNELPIFKGHLLTDEDLIVRPHILDIMCAFNTQWSDGLRNHEDFPNILKRLSVLESDGLIELSESGLLVTETGKPFVRNICMCLDFRLQRQVTDGPRFSLTV